MENFRQALLSMILLRNIILSIYILSMCKNLTIFALLLLKQ